MKTSWNQGLYRPEFEHDNCGIGAVVNMKGKKTHDTVENALKIVENLEHRAGKDAEGKKLVVFRLWNHGGAEQYNAGILKTLECFFPKPWVEERRGIRIGNRVYLEYGDKFDWPDLSAEDHGEQVFCYGLRDQIGVLCDGSVVPCCLDHDGALTLGNLFDSDLETILEAKRAKAIYQGFQQRLAVEELCRKCGYARRFG